MQVMILKSCNATGKNYKPNMSQFNSSKTVPYSIDLVKSVILDVESYPDFLPWCKKAIILEQQENEIIAQLTINFKKFEESYISKITVIHEDSNVTINSIAISGPFKWLNSSWQLKKQNLATNIYFFIDFQLKSQILDIIMDIMFHNVTKQIIRAFEDRLKKLHK